MSIKLILHLLPLQGCTYINKSISGREPTSWTWQPLRNHHQYSAVASWPLSMAFRSINPPPLEHAQFAVISRLISCLVTERILRAFYISFQQPIHDAVGLLVVLSTRTIAEDANSYRPFRSEDIFVMIPLHHPPVFRDLQTRKHGQLVGLVDPLDMIPRAYEFKVGEKDHDVYFFLLLLKFSKFIAI